jgi:hypothetical protein
MAYSPTKPREYGSTKDVVGRLIADAGGAKHAAFILERAASQVYAYADPDVDAQISLDMARRLAAVTGSIALAEDIAALAGGIFMPIKAAPDAITELSAKSSEEHGDLMGALMRAAADGVIDECEARDLLQRCDQHLRAVVALRAKLVGLANERG